MILDAQRDADPAGGVAVDKLMWIPGYPAAGVRTPDQGGRR
jgi:hypothetical protein